MLKIIFTIAIIAGIYYLFIKKPALGKSRKKEGGFETKKRKEGEEIMVECENCATFVSSQEAIIMNGKYYCSKECAEIEK